MIRHFKDDSCTGIQLTFSIINDMGKAELGAGEGVTREVFTFFVLETLCKCDDSGGGGGGENVSHLLDTITLLMSGKHLRGSL